MESQEIARIQNPWTLGLGALGAVGALVGGALSTKGSLDPSLLVVFAVAGGILGALVGAVIGSIVAGVLSAWRADRVYPGRMGLKLGFVFGVFGGIGGYLSFNHLPQDEVAVRIVIVSLVWAAVGFFLAFITGWIIVALKGAPHAAHRVTSAVSGHLPLTGVERRLDEIEELYVRGKISDIERAEARARILSAR